MPVIARMLDANVNRAREALRVMEDATRFALDDQSLCSDLKTLRHELRDALSRLPGGWLEANRDTPSDVGMSITTDSEMLRTGMGEVVIAAGKRLTEALRVIEEASKTVDPAIARQIESLRYRAYDADQRLTLRLGTGRARQWRLCLVLTRSLCVRPWREVLTGAIDGGAECVQVREKDMDGGELAAHARDVIAIARRHNVSVIVNDRADVALAIGADGVHVGQSDLSVRDVRRLAGRTLLVGVSTHDLDEAARAIDDGADYCGVGAMFPSSTKQRETSGLEYLQQFVERYPGTPHLAIGGLTQENTGAVVASGAKGVAVSAAICGASEPKVIAQSLTALFERAESGVIVS